MNKYPQDFYPTPNIMINKMMAKIDWSRTYYFLEPSAGSGNIVKQIRERRKHYQMINISVIEKDTDLSNMLIGAGEKLVGRDFLTYAGLVQFDTIIMNPPFSSGDAHLLKAIDIMYSGQICCLLNAETLRNPYSNRRKELRKKLDEYQAKIEYIQNAFLDAERKTPVEIALIYIDIKRDVKDDILKGATDRVKEFECDEVDGQIKDIALPGTIEAIVKDYNFRVEIGIKTIQEFYKNDKYIGNYLSITPHVNDDKDKNPIKGANLTNEMKDKTNLFLSAIRSSYWEKTLKLPEFEKRLTMEKQDQFRDSIKRQHDLEFTVDNVRAFFENLMHGYHSTLSDAIEKLFDEMTIKYHWDESIHCKSVHYYNGWKTNDAFKVNKRVIMVRLGVNPYYAVYSNRLDYNSERKFDDIDKVMNFFEGKSEYLKSSEAIKKSENIFTIIDSEFFKIRIYKKGTTHLTFKSEDIRRRFNIEAGKRKGWLPADYGYVPFKELPFEKQEIVKSFEESVEDYDKNLNQIGFAKQELLRIGA